jgi:hypothetical protein
LADFILRKTALGGCRFVACFDVYATLANPARGCSEDERLKRLDIGVLVVDKYRLYVVKLKTVQIRRVIYGARRYSLL